MSDRDPGTPSEAPSAKGETLIEEPTRAERSLARRVAESRATVPDLELRAQADVSACLTRSEYVEGHRCVTAVLVRACATALREVPRANAAYRDGRFELYSRVNIGLSLAIHESVEIATLFDADTKPLDEIEEELARMAGRARAGRLTSPERAGATFTLAAASERGATSSTILITPPQAAALAAGAVRETPVVRGAEVVPGLTVALTLACDHRILYGPRAHAFLNRIKVLLEDAGSW